MLYGMRFMQGLDFLKPRRDRLSSNEKEKEDKIEHRAHDFCSLLEAAFGSQSEFTRKEAGDLYTTQQWEGIYSTDEVPTDFDRVMTEIRDIVPRIKEIDGRFVIFPKTVH